MKHPSLYIDLYHDSCGAVLLTRFDSGEYDPVTPIAGAYNGSSGFSGSVVLAHSGYGHGLLADPSRCASRYVQQYLQNGTLPSNGTTCEPDRTTLEIWRANMQASNASSNGTSNTNGTPSTSPSSSGSAQPSGSGAPAQSENAGSNLASGALFTTATSAAILLGSLVLNL